MGGPPRRGRSPLHWVVPALLALGLTPACAAAHRAPRQQTATAGSPRRPGSDPADTTLAAQPTYVGRAGQVRVAVPRTDAPVTVDGVLGEEAWSRAALLTGFSSYSPVDGAPADDSTEVLVWYAPTAIHFGIRAFEPHGSPHATLAQRDHIDADDFVQILLDTFREGRRAFVFAVNPLGVQADGIRLEGEFGGGAALHEAFGAGSGATVDLNPDFRFASRGRITPWGYEVELSIPFASLRYENGAQTWGVQVIRRVQHSGYQQTWTPARRGRASFLAQSGTLSGLTNLRRGLVYDVTPEVTARALGVPPVAGEAGWGYRAKADLGASARWALTPSLTLNATIRPDFSQVEADATLIAPDIRFAVAYPEKRPFFTDAIEEFETPNQLFYSRRIIQPAAAAKLTGRIGAAAIAALAAVDQRDTTGGDHPVFGVVRARRDLAAGTTLAVTLTDRETRAGFNRVASVDVRVPFRKLYVAQVQLAGSDTRGPDARRSAPLWQAMADRSAHRFGFRYELTGIGPAFDAAAGFVPRTDLVRLMIGNRVSARIAPGSLLELWVLRSTVLRNWLYDDFFAARSALERHEDIESAFTFRGGWSLGLTPMTERFAFDPRAYAHYALVPLASAARDTVPFAVPGPVSVYGAVVSVQTPQFRSGSATLTAFAGRDVDFAETAPARRINLSASADLRPTQQLRLTASHQWDIFRRWSDGSTAAVLAVPRLKAEYQLRPAVFFRVVGQYESRRRDALRDPRTGSPILIRSGAGYAPATYKSSNVLRADWLFSYQPAPGTVAFVGYGGSLTEQSAFAFRQLDRTADGFFVKISYLMRP